MRHQTKTKVVKEVEERTIVVTCDLCGQRAHDWYGQSQWVDSEAENNVAETDMSCKVGFNREFGGVMEEITADICVECFKSKVVPALEAIGVKFTKRGISV